MGKENIGAPVIGEIQSKAVIIPIAIDTFPKILNRFSIEFSTVQNYHFFNIFCHPKLLFNRRGAGSLIELILPREKYCFLKLSYF